MEILKDAGSVRSYLEQVCDAADSQKNELGFLPDSAYAEQAEEGRLWIAIEDEQLVGYLLFGGTYPHLRVTQLYVAPEHRGKRVGQRLVAALVEYGQSKGYLTIAARVASDLPANSFWERVGFPCIKTKSGGRTTGRTINIRVRRLPTPTIFDWRGGARVIISGQDALFASRPINREPTYALDINVLIDFLRSRAGREDVERMIVAHNARAIRLIVTPEADAEIRRNAPIGSRDPLAEFAAVLPTLPAISEEELGRTTAIVEPLVFPVPTSDANEASRRRSDLRHLAYCVSCHVDGFVTRDRQILFAADKLREAIRIDVIAPSDLSALSAAIDSSSTTRRAVVGGRTVEFSEHNQSDDGAVQAFFQAQDVAALANRFWRSPSPAGSLRRICAFSDGECIGAAIGSIPRPIESVGQWFVLVDESHAAAAIAVDHFLELAIRSFKRIRHGSLDIVLSADATRTERALRNRGLRPISESDPNCLRLRRLVAHGYMAEQDWPNYAEWFSTAVGWQLNPAIPRERLPEATVACRDQDGRVVELQWFDLETVTGPVLHLFRSKVGAVVPITQEFRGELLGSRQGVLFPERPARLMTEKAYFKRPDSRLQLQRGLPLIFYESQSSGGEGAAIGCARLTHVGTYSIDRALMDFESQGVLSRDQLAQFAQQGRVQILVFDNFQEFDQPVRISQMRQFGAVGPTNLVTTEVVPIEAVTRVLKAGLRHD